MSVCSIAASRTMLSLDSLVRKDSAARIPPLITKLSVPTTDLWLQYPK